MACFSPLTGYRPIDGSSKLTFIAADGFVDTATKIACGQCRGCRLETARQWAVRCMHEAQMHERNCFLTLTYSDENLPADQSINVRHWQLFAKRMRFWQGPFRFYHCGEYGEQTNRPHYHALIFGLDFFEDRQLHKITKGGHNLYTCEALDELWKQGHVYIGELTQQSASYCARYSMKKLNGDQADEQYGERVCQDTGLIEHYRARPYSTMSRKPGIGSTWFDKYHSDLYPSDNCVTGGNKGRVPRYYDSLLEKTNPEQLEELKKKRRIRAIKHADNNDQHRLTVREKVLERKIKSLSRNQN